MDYAMHMVKPPSKQELAEMEADRAAERDLEILLEAAKIRKDEARFSAVLGKREKMRAELERIDPLAPAPAKTESA
jgi:hypothetical protein